MFVKNSYLKRIKADGVAYQEIRGTFNDLRHRGLTYIVQTGILYSKRTRCLFYISTAGAALTLLFNLVFIPIMDVYGAALAQLCVAAFTIVATYMMSQKFHRIMYEWMNPLKILVTTSAFYSGFYFFSHTQFLPLRSGNIALFILYGPALILSGGVNKRDIRSVASFIRRTVTRSDTSGRNW